MSDGWIWPQLSTQTPALWLLISLLSGVLLLVSAPHMSRRWRRGVILGRWILVPYLGLLAGGLSPRLMGLASVNWLVSLNLGLGLILAVLLLLFVVRATVGAPDGDEQVAAPPALAGMQQSPNRIGWPRLVATVIYSGAEQFHWVFLRAALWEILLRMPSGPQSPAYTAVWLAVLPAIAESMILERQNARRLLKLVIIITTSILFLYTRNFWLCWVLHAAIALIVAPAAIERNAGLTLPRSSK